MSNRIIAIGDIHGCAPALDTLLDELALDAGDTVVTLGDYIDRGPQSRQVLDALIELSDRCEIVPLLGNHEAMMLMSRESDANRQFWLDCGGRETLQSYGGDLSDVSDSHWNFIERCGACYETDTHLFFHANYDPVLAPDQQTEFDLFWNHLSHPLPQPHCSGKIAVVGHTPQPDGEILDAGHLVCIDTYCFGGGWLTALDVASGRVWQADAKGRLRAP